MVSEWVFLQGIFPLRLRLLNGLDLLRVEIQPGKCSFDAFHKRSSCLSHQRNPTLAQPPTGYLYSHKLDARNDKVFGRKQYRKPFAF